MPQVIDEKGNERDYSTSKSVSNTTVGTTVTVSSGSQLYSTIEAEDYTRAVISKLDGTDASSVLTVGNSNYYVPWYHIKLGNPNTDDYWEILSNGNEDDNPIVQIEHKKNGSGLCNSFTIVLACRLTSSTTKIDKVLSKAGLDATGSQFELQYGYGPPHNIKSPLYNGILTSYSIEAQNGLLIYTIIGYSSIVKANSEMISLKGIYNVTSADGTTENTSGRLLHPTEVVESLISSYAQEHSNPDEYSYFDYILGAPEGLIGSDQAIDLQSALSLVSSPTNTLTGWIDWLLSLAVYEKDTEDTPVQDKSMYTYIIIDKDTIGSDHNMIYLKRYCISDQEASIDIDFEWGNVSDNKFNLVHEFRPQFSGEIAIAMMSNSQDKSTNPAYKITDSGEVEYVGMSSDFEGSADIEETKTSDDYTWAKMIEENLYKAQLVTAGIPADIPILTTIHITPYIGGVKHSLTAGDYYVLSSVDTIDGNGFVTKLELFKVYESTSVFKYTPPDNTYKTTDANSPSRRMSGHTI